MILAKNAMPHPQSQIEAWQLLTDTFNPGPMLNTQTSEEECRGLNMKILLT
jgi:hypothetical protein